MKISNSWIATSVALAFSSTICAQNPTVQQSNNAANQNQHKLDNKTSGPGVRVSKLIGMKIQNSRKENVGQISDIVVDPMSTRIQYVAVTYGGFLGLGDKLFPVPMQAIKVQPDPDNRDRVILVLDVTKEQMNGAQGFDESNWPNFSDSKFSSELHRRYKIEDHRNSGANRDGKVDLQINRDGIKVNVDPDKK